MKTISLNAAYQLLFVNHSGSLTIAAFSDVQSSLDSNYQDMEAEKEIEAKADI